MNEIVQSNYGYYAVAFIDVLGQKGSFQDIVHLPTNEQEAQKLKRADEETVIFVETLRESFKNVFDEIIPGLYAAGEIIGGFHGAGYVQGTALGKAFVLGRTAGREASQ